MNSRNLCRAGALALALACASPVNADPAVTAPGFRIDKLADVPTPLAIEVSPPGSPFGASLYAASSDIRFFQGEGPPDLILRIDTSTGQVSPFFELPAESDPIWLTFGPGAPFTTDLYISANNRDGGIFGDDGGSIVFLAPDPTVAGEQFLTPRPPGTVLSEPGALAFGRGGGFGTDLFVGNTNDPPYDIARIAPDGTRTSFTAALGDVSGAIVFGPGGAFGSDLYVTDFFGGRIWTVDAAGSPTLFATLPAGVRPSAFAFAPPGPFGGDMYLSTMTAAGTVSVFRVGPDGAAVELAGGFLGAAASGASFAFPTPDSLAFSSDGRTLFVSDMLSNAVYRIIPDEVEVVVDLVPGSCTNPLNLQSQGVLPVAVVGSAGLDVIRIDPASVALEGVAAVHWSLADVSGPAQAPGGCPAGAADGVTDLTLKFDIQAVAAKLGAVADGSLRQLTLTGRLKPEFGGTAIAGGDTVRIIRKK